MVWHQVSTATDGNVEHEHGQSPARLAIVVLCVGSAIKSAICTEQKYYYVKNFATTTGNDFSTVVV